MELARGRATWRFVELAARKLLSLSVDCRQSDDPTGEVLEELKRHDLQDTVLRLEILLTPVSEALLNNGAVIEAIKRAGVFHIAGIRKQVERGSRSRLGVSPEGLSPLELLERYFESRDVDEARREELLQFGAGDY